MIKVVNETVNPLARFSALNEDVKIYVPSTVSVSHEVDNSSFVEYVETQLSKLFGGCTTYSANGNYVSNDGKLISEKVNIVQAFTTELQNEHIEKAIEICEYLKTTMSQECVSLEVKGKLYFI
ncbi:hypothetical protein PQE68_gp004 [Bacillus phage vB_BanS_Sophrita]|uniref:Uncharacterized protein n=1 Tax=Bacillus phage vB_BanS_Sophrita TaxID=2894790 RepID=A0AAE9CDB2_9CAUD|nr:hypothetical protein PQE68_gp004 [Bacillus phage vB_BanS_Sophrita]UGO50595.1 hypothetical protein SOPHRITA_4 [Bacillus phage vB_BanS_Sophrita]